MELKVVVSDLKLVKGKRGPNSLIRCSITVLVGEQPLFTGRGALFTAEHTLMEAQQNFGGKFAWHPYELHEDIKRAAVKVIENQAPDLVSQLPDADPVEKDERELESSLEVSRAVVLNE